MGLKDDSVVNGSLSVGIIIALILLEGAGDCTELVTFILFGNRSNKAKRCLKGD